MYRTIVEALIAHGTEKPEHVAVCTKSEQITYGELLQRVKNAAAFMEAEGVTSRDHVMVTAFSTISYVIAYFAVHYLGAVAAPVDKGAVPESILGMMEDMDITYAFLGPKQQVAHEHVYDMQVLEDAPDAELSYHAPENMDALCDLLFTTGTTGKSKGVMITYRSLLCSVKNVQEGVSMTEEDVILLPVPLNHSFGIREMRTVLYTGATAVLQNGFMFVKELANNIRNFGCTGLTCVPSAMNVVCQKAGDKLPEVLGNGHLRYIEFCTAPLEVPMKEKLRREIPDIQILNSYGSTETPGVIYLNVNEKPDKLKSIGRGLSTVDVKIVDEQGNTIQSDIEHIGRLAFRGDMMTKGYYRAQELTDEVIKDGWFFTNDIAYIDEDGFIFLLGRANDVINVGGKKVAPSEIEQLLDEYPGVSEAVCIGVPDPKGMLGMVPVAYLTIDKENYMPDQIKDYMQKRTEHHKVPIAYEVISEIPRNYMGKIERNKLKEMWKNR